MINCSGCPILLVSKIQTDIALSTLFSEYVSFYQSLRELFPIKATLQELISKVGMKEDSLWFETKYTVFEDNLGALKVATYLRFTPNSNLISV